MAKVKLRGVDTKTGCVKPNCCTGSRTLNRHHKRHEAMFLGIWASRRRGEPRWIEFVRRYREFHKDDIVIICVSHHAEIHAIYDRIIRQDIDASGKPLAQYTWDEANRLMNKLEAACLKWLQDETPGISSNLYGSYKSRRREEKLRENSRQSRKKRK